MKFIITLLLLASCSKGPVEEFTYKPVLSSGFNSTQEYQIMCWMIKKYEGYREDTYKCQAGKKTVGWGFTNVSSVRDIHHADEIFHDIVNPLFKEVRATYPDLNYLQCAVITSLYYNTGNLYSIKTSKFSKALKLNNVKKAVKSFKSWNKVRVGKGKFIVSKGLVKRRSFEAKLLEGSFSMKDYESLKKEVSNIYKQNRA
jgi:GH24 family phage-related lysozyme (muramidase)